MLTRDQLQFWYLMTFLLGLIEGMVGTFFPLIFINQGGSLVILSLMVSFISLAGILQTFWGRLIDHYQRPKSLGSVSLLFSSGSLVTMGYAPSSTVFGGSRIFQGLNSSAFNMGNAYLRSAYFPSSRRGRVGNLFMGFNLLGVALGVFLTGYFYDWAGLEHFRFIHLLAAYLCIVTLFIMWKYIPEFSEDLVADEQLHFAMVEDKANLKYSLRDTLYIAKKSPGLLLFIMATLIFHFSVGISGPFFILDLSQRWSLSSLEIGYITTFNALLQVVIIFLFTPIVDIIDRKTGFTIGIAFAIIPVIAMVMSPDFILTIFSTSLVYWMIIYLFSSLGWGLVNALSLTLLIDYIHPKIRATVVGIYGSLQALFVFLASILAAVLINAGGTTQLMFWVSLAGRCLALFVLLRVIKPPIPSSDFYDRRKIFFTRVNSTVERGIVWLPVVGSILRKKSD